MYHRTLANCVALIGLFGVGLFAGWLAAHQEVATECERQGGFYVGKRDFVCSPKAKEN